MDMQWELVTRLLVAAALGSLVGIERERLSWAAGLRTHMLVCVGSALIMIVSAYGFADVQNDPHVSLDPSRMAAQVVSGIGFLGAGTILLRGEIVRGLTTAASLWYVAGLGLAVGGGLYIPAIAATAIALLILAGLKPLERRYLGHRKEREFRLFVQAGTVDLNQLNRALSTYSGQVRKFVVQPKSGGEGIDEVIVRFTALSNSDVVQIVEKLQLITGMREIAESNEV